MITESLGYLHKSDDWVKTLLIGGVLGLLGVLVVPLFITYGYLVRVLRVRMEGGDDVPAFDDWGEMTVDGLRAFAITFVYGLVPVILAGAFVVAGVAGLAGSGDSGILAGIGGATVLFGALLAVILGLAAAYVTPAALANYAETGRIGSGFAFGELRPVLASGEYLTAWAYAALLGVAGSVVVGLVSATGVGAVVAPFVWFYVSVAAAFIFGTTWGELHPVRTHEGTPAERAAI